MSLTKIKITYLALLEYQRKYLALQKNTTSVRRDVRAVNNSRRSTLIGLVTIGLPALERCQKANTKLCSRRLKPSCILSLLHNVLDSRRSGGSLEL